jgi:hypothetical protein
MSCHQPASSRVTAASASTGSGSAKALYAAALTDDAARAAWEDRMAHLRAFTASVAARLAQAGGLAPGWDAELAADWLAAQLNPIGWVLLVVDSGWEQERCEERMAAIVRAVLVDPATARA